MRRIALQSLQAWRIVTPGLLLLAIGWLACDAVADPAPTNIIETPEPTQLSIEEEDRLMSGMVLELGSATAESGNKKLVDDARRARMLALRVADNEYVSPFLPAGPFVATWQGYLLLDMGSVFDFSAVGNGHLRLTINGREVLQCTVNEMATAQRVELHAGFNRFELKYTSPAEGESRIRLLWTGDDFVTEPIPPTSLYHDPLDPLLTKRTELRRGRELFAVRGCAKCHGSESDSIDAADATLMPEFAKDNPDLRDVMTRVQPAWLYEWLLNPHALRNDVSMPAPFLGNTESERRRSAADVVAFLAESAPSADAGRVSSDIDPEFVEEGEILFEELACLGCHRLTEPGEPDDFDRVSLHFAGAKYQPGALEAFLRAPHEHYAWNRMPGMQLSVDEAVRLSAFIRAESGMIDAAADLFNGNAARGREQYTQRGCANCHQLDSIAESIRVPLATDRLPAKGCLALSDADRGRAPFYSLDEPERKSLMALNATELASVRHQVPQEISQRYWSSLRCSVCHDKDDELNLLTDISYEESVTGRAPEQAPHLTWAGEKLHRPWMEDLFAGRLDYNSRPWLKGLRMPQFPQHAVELAEGLAAEHGVSPEEAPTNPPDPKVAKIGQKLTLQAPQGFYCIQCHAVGEKAAIGAFDHRGINFELVVKRLRHDYYRRWITDPLRMDPGSKMPKLAPDGETTTITDVYEGDAQQQFAAIWEYLRSLAR